MRAFRTGSAASSFCPSASHQVWAQILRGMVSRLARLPDWTFEATLDGRTLRAKTILLATGVIDKEPELPNLFNAVQRGLVRHCGICDGYEVIDHKTAVIATWRGRSRRSTFSENPHAGYHAAVAWPAAGAGRRNSAQNGGGGHRVHGRYGHACCYYRRREDHHADSGWSWSACVQYALFGARLCAASRSCQSAWRGP